MAKIAAIQMEITSNKEVNLEKAKTLLEKAALDGAKIAVLPEYFLADCPEAGMSKEFIESIAESIPGPATDYLAQVAKATGIYICAGSFVAKGEDGKLRNTSAFISPKGEILGTFSKVHPENAAPKYEVSLDILPGDEFPVFDTEFGKVGILIDMDATVPEAARILYVKGAEIILLPLNWSTRWLQVIEILPQAHASMNKLYFAAANRVGTRTCPHGTFVYNGGSKICNPEGFVCGRGDDFFEGYAIAEVHMDLVKMWRGTIIPRDYPFRRRPEVYGAITEPWTVG